MVDIKQIVGVETSTLRTSSLADDAATKLRELILLEKLPPGTSLSERDLADALGVSRTPMRDAIRKLAAEGLVAHTPSRRPFVANPSIDEINDCLRVQGALESLAGELACKLASEDEILQIAQCNISIQKAEAEGDTLGAFRLDMTFHEAIVAAAHNQALAETHATYNARLWRVRFLSSRRAQSLSATRTEHALIVDALSSRNTKAARKALATHLKTAEINIAAALAERQATQ